MRAVYAPEMRHLRDGLHPADACAARARAEVARVP